MVELALQLLECQQDQARIDTVEKQFSKLISDSTGQPSVGYQGRQKKELTDVANELITTLADYQKTAPSPFLALPIHIQESILSRVPVMYLIRFLNVSKDFRSLFSLLPSPTFPPPPPDIFFLLFSPYLYKNSFRMGSPKLLSFHPSSSRWIELPIPSNSPLCHSRPLVTSSSLAVTKFPHDKTLLVTGHMFSPLPPNKTPPMISIGNPSVVAVIPDGDVTLSGHFKIVATSYMEAGMLCSQVYDSRRREWVLHGIINCCLELPHKAAVLNNSLYMRSCRPDQLLQFDLTSGTWNYVLPIPECLCTHIFSYDQNVYLVVGQGTRNGSLLSIRVFMLDWMENSESPKWREISVLSEKDGAFVEFRGNNYVMSYFDAVDRNGLVCLFNQCKTVLLFDVRNKSWVLVPPHPLPCDYPFWYGHAIEMGLEVLRSN
ncbi:Galactose oxidase/kelch repeat superfamily protein [Rhynchospora pubera]|uniref:Galactose oxidase/kelch repeat superfamily protein n=1 Tax=Rhynchospora pubera TaxID=906938 RepID=A0AAV8FZJ6_9POAL|nr:Galactose oxidase/kelch repeat superfamily protein [Rhynchospora pubera]